MRCGNVAVWRFVTFVASLSILFSSLYMHLPVRVSATQARLIGSEMDQASTIDAEKASPDPDADRGVDANDAVRIPVLGNDGISPEDHQAQIQQRWTDLSDPYYNGALYEESPSAEAPYSAGRLAGGYMHSALEILNFCRYLSGLPDDVELSDHLVDIAQHGAVLLAASEYGHEPSQPSDMSDAFYEKGYAATVDSNIAWSRLAGDTMPIMVYDAWMADNTDQNLDHVSHRRWILNPLMQYTGFGQAADGELKYFAMYSRDESRQTAVQYGAIAYPAGPAFPREFFSGHTPWSISISPVEYKTPDPNQILVTLTGDGCDWVLSADSVEEDSFFAVSTANSGVGNAIIFRPSGVSQYTGEYHVKVEGLEHKSGLPAYLEYDVTFFSLQERPHTVDDRHDNGETVYDSMYQSAQVEDPQLHLVGDKEETLAPQTPKTGMDLWPWGLIGAGLLGMGALLIRVRRA